MTATVTGATRALRRFVVHGAGDDKGVTVPVMATGQQDALDRSGLACGWIHDDTLTDCPRCTTALGAVSC